MYIVHHHYAAEKDDELNLEIGELISVSDMSDPGWWVGETVKDGKTGWFPSNFVEPFVEEASKPVETVPAPAHTEPAEDTTPTAPAASTPAESAPPAPKHEGPVLARVEYDYEAKEPGELSLEAGRVVTILDSNDPAWWTGDLNGKIGTFPSNYVKLIESKEESEGSAEKPTKFRLAAFGVKQGGLGSLFAGGVVPGLKKTGGLKKLGGVDTSAQPGSMPKRTSVDEPRSPVVHAAPPKMAPPPVVEEVAAPVAPQAAPSVVAPVAAPVVHAMPPRATPPPPPPVEEVAAPSEPRVPSRAKKPKSKQNKAFVIYEYTAQEDDEISLSKGSTVVVTDKMGDEGWWCGRNEQGEIGNFPSDFVQEIKEEQVQSPTVAPAVAAVPVVPPPAPASASPASVAPVQEETPKSPVHSRTPMHAPVALPPIPVEPIRTDLPRSRTSEAPLATPPAIPRGSRPASMIASPTQVLAHLPDAHPLIEDPLLPSSPTPKRLSMAPRSSSHDAPESPRLVTMPVLPSTPEVSSPTTSQPAQGERSRSNSTLRRPQKPVPGAPLLETEEESQEPVTQETTSASEEIPSQSNRNSYILPTPVSRNRPLPPLARPPSIHQASENRRSVVIPPTTQLPPVPSEPEETVQEVEPIQEEEDEPEIEQYQHEAMVPAATPEATQTETVVHKEDEEEPIKEMEEPVVVAREEDEMVVKEEEQEEPTVTASVVEEEESVVEEKEPEAPKLPEVESSGPTLSHASRPRPAKGRKPPSAPVPNPEDSFVAQLEADVKAAPIVEEKKPEPEPTPAPAPVVEKAAPPPKPIKPIFQKFPTPFAGVQPMNIALRPTGRRIGSGNDSSSQSPPGSSGESTVTPAASTASLAGGVKSLSSRFGQFQGVPTSGGNSAALELDIAKLKRWMNEEIDRVREELAKERESREKLQEEVNQLKAQLQG
ncbi:SH3-domain kinase binding protein 1 [Mortierella polycephala]|uniref:SH3-domain kinase binding protein 1 n=1 Tax=Mortierella polycephala TaxID=41804 RepID=A0A9P6U558_9FUNG|nr:SH3-domain kinase binding protein 1 [Mortierella polycephala]